MDYLEELNLSWSDNAKKDRLFIAIVLNDTTETERLKAEGVGLSDHIKGMLKNGGGSLAKPNEYGVDWYKFCGGLSKYLPEEFVRVISSLRAELGEPIYFSDTVFMHVPNFYSAEVFRCVLECFNNNRINKKWALVFIIENDMPGLLETAAEHGWFRTAKKCDEYIEYAQSNNSIECAALLLDYKNRTFDAAREREKAEKRQSAELNAAPDSITMMKKLWTYRKLEDGTIAIKHYKGNSTEIVIPEKIGNDIVTELKVDIFEWGEPKRSFVMPEFKHTVTKITLPKGLVLIGSSVFHELTGLCEINIPDGVVSIGNCTFYNCTKLKRLALPDSVKEIGYRTFQNCLKLEEINIPDGITKINNMAFARCERLRAVELPESVRSFGVEAFYDCKSLETITIPEGVTEISESMFSGCEKLTSVRLPDTLVKINKFAFSGCSSLKEIVIPEGVREIDMVAFGQCTALERVVLPASLEKAKNYTQKGIAPRTIFFESPNVTAVVPPNSYAEKYCKRNNIAFVYD